MPLCIWAGVLGLAISPVFVVTETLIQRQSPRGHLGRVFAAREALIKTAYLGAAVLATGINAIVSKASILVALGLFLALLGVVLERTRWLRTDETEEQEGS
jgi:MFS family permease